MTAAIWWIRRDLRLEDNTALTLALARGRAVLPVFVLDPALLASPYSGEKRLAFLLGGLRALDADLRARGSRLIVRRGRPEAILAVLAEEAGAGEIVAEADYSPYALARDARVAAVLPLTLVEGLTVHPPGAVLKSDGRPYTVFTPFSRTWKAIGLPGHSDLLPAPAHIPTPPAVIGEPLPDMPGQPTGVIFPPGADEARRRLEAFTGGEAAPVYCYRDDRNRLDLDGTSGLSPYLRFGMLSARQAAVRAGEVIAAAPDSAARESAETWLNELIWREFYVHILAQFPFVREISFRESLRAIAWRNEEAAFDAWREGRTGYPVVDAAMRQLLATGWMHNRARMVVASFLTKDLLIDWRWGEQHFMAHLIDGDPAANNGGWQWTAGTGTDAAPYFRIFNPVSQGQKFDPQGEYVRRWVPELARVPAAVIHEPWRMSETEQRAAGCVIGRDYPAPIIDHGRARQRALAAYGGAGALR
ncbi:MAG: deoxyribodipyrimidine photo-lyase [Anaerolineae bacterium]|nr:deoxyribodipyrimidine photo-lyase [Anaerolineae bacterium]